MSGSADRDKVRLLLERIKASSSLSSDELDFLGRAFQKQPRGRPKDPPAERVFRRLKLAMVAEAIYRGQFPYKLQPPNLTLAVSRAKNHRRRADEVTGLILNASVSAVEKARLSIYPTAKVRQRRRLKPMDHETWEEFVALMALAFRN